MAAHGEWVGNLGYVAFSTEATPGTAVTPTVFGLLDNETLTTSYNLEDQAPIAGTPFETFQILPGLRDHKGDIELVAEPNTAAQLVDMLLKRGSKSGGSDPYTWPFTVDGSTAPNSKTIDISTGNIVKRFVGVQASKLTPVFSKNMLNLKVSVSALGSFQGGVLASAPTGSNPYTAIFDTTYDTNPTAKLVVGDLIRGYLANGTTIDATIATIVDAKTITTTTNITTMAQGDIIYLRPATQSLSLKSPFLWSNTQFCFGSTASAALSAAQTRVEQGSSWELDYAFESDNGSQRSGSFDPASLPRTTAKSMLTIKKFFDTPTDVINFNNQNKTACVIRHYAYDGAVTHELRITLNNIKTDDPMPKVKAKAINYSEIKYKPQYDTSDAQEFDVKVINSLTALG